MAKKDEKIIWSDRKRTIFGLPWTFTKYCIDNDRLYVKKGFFKTEIDEILIYRILDLKLTRTLRQKLDGVGTILLYSADQTHRTLELKNIKKPQQTQRLISDLIESERKERGLIGRELAGTAGLDMDHMDGSCDTHDHTDAVSAGMMPPPPINPGSRDF